MKTSVICPFSSRGVIIVFSDFQHYNFTAKKLHYSNLHSAARSVVHFVWTDSRHAMRFISQRGTEYLSGNVIC